MLTRRIILIGLLINFVFCILPIYDTINIYTSLNLGALSFHNSVPILYFTTNPASFFSSIYLVPIGLEYTQTLSLYATALILKLIIFLFFSLFVLLMEKIFIQSGLQQKRRIFIIALILFNPGIILIDFIWAELVMIPVFFVTLSFFFARYISFRNYTWNALLSAIFLFISVFFLLYPVIFIPAFLVYTKGVKNRIVLTLSYVLIGTAFFLLQVFVFQGYVFNYIGSLSGSIQSLAVTSLDSGIFYFLHLNSYGRLVTELVLLVIVTLFPPLMLYRLGYSESRALYIVSALFLFISLQIDMDNFLFIVPFVFLALIKQDGEIVSCYRGIIIISLLFLVVIFAPVYYYHNFVYAGFYWFYPLTHVLGPKASVSMISNLILPYYNYTFAFLVFISILLTLFPADKINKRSYDSDNIYKKNKKEHLTIIHPKILISDLREKTEGRYASLKKISIISLILLILLSIPFSLVYNYENNSVHLSNPHTFPSMYFYAEYAYNSPITPSIGQDSYSYFVNGSELVIPSATHRLLFERNLTEQNFSINMNVIVSGVLTNNITLVSTNLWKLNLNVMENDSQLHEIILYIANKHIILGGYYNDSTALEFTFTNNLTNSLIAFNNTHVQTRSASYFNVGKLNNSNASIVWIINGLTITYPNSGGYYLVPAFLAFYFPLIFAVFTTEWILLKDNRLE